MTKEIVAVDIDGTVSDPGDRTSLLPHWDEFFDAGENDQPKEEVCDLVRRLSSDYEIVWVTGRPERYRAMTARWLIENCPCRWRRLIMRKDGDHRPDRESKLEMYLSLEKERIQFVLEDSIPVADALIAEGVRVLLVHPGQGHTGGVDGNPIENQ